MKKELKLTINGQPCEVFVKPKTTLVELLRDELRMTGTKTGCQDSACGACTVILDGKAVKSCSILAMHANGKEVLTIEGLAEGGHLTPLQEAFLDHGAVQCGFCSPGMIMATKALLDENPNPTEEDVKMSIEGNLCRCTGYVDIVEAVLTAATKSNSEVKK